jgi:hypothetical protein
MYWLSKMYLFDQQFYWVISTNFLVDQIILVKRKCILDNQFKLVISTTNPFLHGIKYVFKDSNKNGEKTNNLTRRKLFYHVKLAQKFILYSVTLEHIILRLLPG